MLPFIGPLGGHNFNTSPGKARAAARLVTAIQLTALIVAGVALFWSAMLTMQAYEHKRFARRCLRDRPRPWFISPPVLVSIPCKGVDLNLADNLRSMLAQTYPNYHVRFVVESANDPACEVIQSVIATATVPCELLIAGACTDSGQKVHNLLCATSNLPANVEVLAFFDSDAKLGPTALERLVARACRGELQIATGYRWFVPERASISNLVLASANAGVAGLMNHQGWNLIWGGAWAITRDVFDRTALAEAWRGTLSDDLVASRVMRAAGIKLSFEPGAMAASSINASWHQAASFLRRQFIIGRLYSPALWWLTIPLLLAQTATQFGGFILAGWLWLNSADLWYVPLLVSTCLYALAATRAMWRQSLWTKNVDAPATALRSTARFDRAAAPFAGVFTAVIMLSSAVGRSIVWRGIHYYIGPAGRIVLLGREPTKKQRQQMYEAQHARCKHDKDARESFLAANRGTQHVATVSAAAVESSNSSQPKRAA